RATGRDRSRRGSAWRPWPVPGGPRSLLQGRAWCRPTRSVLPRLGSGARSDVVVVAEQVLRVVRLLQLGEAPVGRWVVGRAYPLVPFVPQFVDVDAAGERAHRPPALVGPEDVALGSRGVGPDGGDRDVECRGPVAERRLVFPGSGHGAAQR